MSYCRRKNLSGLQARCIAVAAAGPLLPFPRGFAADRMGPFFPLRTVHGLIERKRLAIVKEPFGRMSVRRP
jgi:hypothetical protein